MTIMIRIQPILNAPLPKTRHHHKRNIYIKERVPSTPGEKLFTLTPVNIFLQKSYFVNSIVGLHIPIIHIMHFKFKVNRILGSVLFVNLQFF